MLNETKRLMRKFALLLAGSALAVIASGCGAGVSTGATVARLSKAEYVAAANGICEKGLVEAERKAIRVYRDKARLYEREGDLNEYSGSLRRQEISIVLAPMLRGRIAAVRQLAVPEGDEQVVEEILDSIGAAAAAAKENPYEFLTSGHPLAQARALAAGYGIESCAALYRPDGPFIKASEFRGSA